MNLRLYKSPYFDPVYPHIRRLLFEGQVPADEKGYDADFYIYVWLTVDGYLHAFQAVLGDTITLAFQMPDRMSYGRLSRDIINRGVTTRETSAERSQLISVIDKATSDSFPALLESIKCIVNGEHLDTVSLSKQEMAVFDTLCK